MPRLKHTRADAALDDWAECVSGGLPPEGLAIDTETTGFAWADEAFCATLAWEDVIGRVSAHYIPFPEGLDALREIIQMAAEREVLLVFHNAGFDLKKLIALGVLTRDELDDIPFIDTQCLAIYHDNLQPLKLKGTGEANLVHRYLGRDQTAEFERVKEVKAKLGLTKDDGYDLLPASVLVPYAIQDARDTLGVWKAVRAVPDRWLGKIAMEMEVALALLDMETAGMAVDVPFLEEQKGVLGIRLIDAEAHVREMANQITGKRDWTPPSRRPKLGFPGEPGADPKARSKRRPDPFNPGSTGQLAEVLMALDYKLAKTDKGSWQVDNKAIEKCRRDHAHPFLDAIVEFRRLAKLHGTYITGILSEQVDGILHTSFRQYGTRTGRFSSGAEGEG